jgi:hypothetical protein
MIQNSVPNFSYSILLGHPWLKDAKVSHNWGNNIITIQGMGIVRTIPITKKLGTPTKRLEMLICYDFHYKIFNEKKDIMIATEPGLFLIRTIVVLTLIKLEEPINSISSTSLNLVKQIYVPIEPISILPIMYHKPIKSISILRI